jgi:hypothetical protein
MQFSRLMRISQIEIGAEKNNSEIIQDWYEIISFIILFFCNCNQEIIFLTILHLCNLYLNQKNFKGGIRLMSNEQLEFFQNSSCTFLFV